MAFDKMTRKASPWDKRTWLCESPIREGKQSRNSGFSTSPPAQSAGTLWLLSVNDLKSPIVQQKYPKLWMVAKSCTKRMRETLPWDKPHINWWFHTSYPTVKEQQQYDPRVVPGGLHPPHSLGLYHRRINMILSVPLPSSSCPLGLPGSKAQREPNLFSRSRKAFYRIPKWRKSDDHQVHCTRRLHKLPPGHISKLLAKSFPCNIFMSTYEHP
jgi:hypothetical protein